MHTIDKVDKPQMNFNIAFVQKSPITDIASMHWLLFAQQITQIVCILKIQTAADRIVLRAHLIVQTDVGHVTVAATIAAATTATSIAIVFETFGRPSFSF